MKKTTNPLLNAERGKRLTFAMAALLGLGAASAHAQTNNYFGISGTLSGTVWSVNPAGPYTSALVTTGGTIINFNNVATFTGASITVAGIVATANATGTPGGTIGNLANGVIPIRVASGVTLDFGSQVFTSSATAGYIKNGDGVLALIGAAYQGGFTLNAGTVIVRGVNALGGGTTTNSLTLNGGTIASNGTRDLTGKYASGITVGGNVQFGDTVGLASATANLTFSNTMSLGTVARTLTLGNGGVVTLGGVISNTASTGLAFAATTGGAGRFDVTNAVNTYAGTTTITGAEVRFTGDGSLGSVPVAATADSIVLDGGHLATASNVSYTLNANRGIQLGATAGTGISATGTAVLSYDGILANQPATTGTLTKLGAGTLALGGASTYTGDTTISLGKLTLSATGTIASSPKISLATGTTFDVTAKAGGYTLPSGQTLAGTGAVLGNIIVGSGSTISPGSSPGNLTLGGATFGSAGNYNWQLFDSSLAAGAGYDTLSIGSTLSIGATAGSPFAINLWSLSGTGPDVSGNALNFNSTTNNTWTLATATGGITGFSADKFTINTGVANGTQGFTNSLNGGTFSVEQSGNNLNLVFTMAGGSADYFWVGNDTTLGGAGTWDASATNSWSASDVTIAPIAWNSAKTANFGGATAGTVTVSTVSAANGLNFTTDGYTLTGGAIALMGADLTINKITVASAMTATINSVLSGSADLAKAGGGTLVLGGANTFTGLLTVSAGTLGYGASNVIADATSVKVDGGTLDVGAFSDTVAGVHLTTGAISGTSGVLTSTTAFDLQNGTVSAILDGSAGLVKTTAGTVTLSAANTYTGLTEVQAGTLALGANDVLADASTVAVSSTLEVGAFHDTVAGVQLTGGMIAGTTGVLTSTTAFDVRSGSAAVSLAGSVGLVKTTAGTVTLTAANAYTGTTAIQEGVLQLKGGNDRLAPASVVVLGEVGTSGKLVLGDAATASNQTLTGLTATGLGGSVVNGGTAISTLTLNIAAGTNTFSGTLGGGTANENNLKLAKAGAGALDLSGTNPYTGGTAISGGVVKALADTALGVGGVTISNGTLNVAAGVRVANSIVIGTAALNGVFGPQTALAAWDFDGLTGGNANYGASPLAPGSVDPGVTVPDGLMRGPGVTTTGTAAAHAWGGTGWSLSVPPADAITAGDFASFSLMISGGPSIVNLDGFAPYNVRHSGSGPTTGLWQYQVEAGAFTDIGSPITWGAGTGASGNAQGALDLSGISALQGLAAGTLVTFRVVNYNATGATGSWYLNSTNGTANDFIVNGRVGLLGFTPATGSGTLGIAEAGIANFTGGITVNSVGELATVAGGTANFDGIVSGPGALTKTGAGIAVLSGVNTFSGGITMSGGTLKVNADSGLGAASAAVAITSNATLQAGGAISTTARTLTLGVGGGTIDTNGNAVTFGVGSSITGTTLTKTGAGRLTVAGTQTYATLDTEEGRTDIASVLGTGTSTVIANAETNFSVSQSLASLTIGDGAVVTLTDALPPAPAFDEGAAIGAGQLQGVPEPGSAALLIGGMFTLLGMRRRR